MANSSDYEQIILDKMRESGKPLKAGEIAISRNLDKAIVSKIIKNLKKKGLVESPKQCDYTPAAKVEP